MVNYIWMPQAVTRCSSYGTPRSVCLLIRSKVKVKIELREERLVALLSLWYVIRLAPKVVDRLVQSQVRAQSTETCSGDCASSMSI
jgi:hypothetical protein